MEKLKKPSERILELKEKSEEFYKNKDIDTKMIATLLNLAQLNGQILDEHEKRIEKLEKNK